MTYLYRTKIYVVWLLLITILSEDSSFAYIDFATGSYILQVVLAGLFAALFFIKSFWRKIVSAVRKKIVRSSSDRF